MLDHEECERTAREADAQLTALRPCPFCGGDPVIGNCAWPLGIRREYFVRCKDCQTMTGLQGHDPIQAINFWNRV